MSAPVIVILPTLVAKPMLGDPVGCPLSKPTKIAETFGATVKVLSKGTDVFSGTPTALDENVTVSLIM